MKNKKVCVPSLWWATDLAPVLQFNLEPILIDCNLENLSVDLDSNKIIVTAFIKKNTGLGFADLINKSRVDYLVELLRQGKYEDYTIEALAKMSGFGSRQTMYKAFAKFRNQSPTNYNNIFFVN